MFNLFLILNLYLLERLVMWQHILYNVISMHGFKLLWWRWCFFFVFRYMRDRRDRREIEADTDEPERNTIFFCRHRLGYTAATNRPPFTL